MKSAILLFLALAGFGAGCANQQMWHPAENEVVDYDSPRQLPSEQWPNAGYEFYRLRHPAPELEADINQHQRILVNGVVVPFVMDSAPDKSSP